MKPGCHSSCSYLKILDSGACTGIRSGVRRNKIHYLTFYDAINIELIKSPFCSLRHLSDVFYR